jgi:hypothetical protein
MYIKSALSVPKTSDLTWLFSQESNQIPLEPSQAILGTLRLSIRRLLVRPYPLISIIKFCLERQAFPYLESVLVQILRPPLGRRPLVVITMYIARRPLDTLRLPRPYRSLNWERLAQHSELCHNEPLAQVEPPKPSGALHCTTTTWTIQNI